MLYVGFLEAPYQAKIRSAYVIGFGALLFILILTGPLILRMARDILSPLERMTHKMERVQKGDLERQPENMNQRDSHEACFVIHPIWRWIIGKSLSLDIRERILSLVEVGHSCHEASRRLCI